MEECESLGARHLQLRHYHKHERDDNKEDDDEKENCRVSRIAVVTP